MKRNDQDKTLAGEEVDENTSFLVRVEQKIWTLISVFQFPRGITF